MSNVVFGSDGVIEVSVSGVYYPVGCFTNFSFSCQNELILKTDVNAGLFRKRRVRISDYSASVHGLQTLENDGITASVMYFLQESVRRTEQDIRFTFTDQAGLSKQIQGFFLIEEIPIQTDISGFSEFDISFKGTGGYTISDVDDSPSPAAPAEPFSDWWATTPGESSISGAGNEGRSFAGKVILEVDREGLEHEKSSGSPVDRDWSYDGTSVSFLIPFEDGERIFVLWKNVDL